MFTPGGIVGVYPWRARWCLPLEGSSVVTPGGLVGVPLGGWQSELFPLVGLSVLFRSTLAVG